MKKQKQKRANLLIFVSSVITAIALLIVCLQWTANESANAIKSTIWFFACFEIAALCVCFCVTLRIDKEWYFDQLHLVEKRNIRRNRLIPYNEIQAIAITAAVNRYFFPITDENGFPKSVITIYDNWSVPRSIMGPHSISPLPASGGEGLSYSFYTPDKLQTLLDKTTAIIFISQQEYDRNQAHLRKMFANSNHQILISVSHDAVQGRFMEFSEYTKSLNQ